MGAETRVWNGAVYRLDSRAESLARKRAISELRLSHAVARGDARTVAAETAQLERIARWEREES